LAPKRVFKDRELSERALRDLYTARALKVVHAVVATSFARPQAAWSGGGIHIGPPRGVSGRIRTSYDFSFKLSLPKGDEELVEQVLTLILGGERRKFDPSGNEWPEKSTIKRK
jgi:hypothetical protein